MKKRIAAAVMTSVMAGMMMVTPTCRHLQQTQVVHTLIFPFM